MDFAPIAALFGGMIYFLVACLVHGFFRGYPLYLKVLLVGFWPWALPLIFILPPDMGD